jgi:hypothetical protein
MAVPKVFVSMGTPYTADYLRFREELESFLRDQCRVDPRIIGKNEYPTGSPLAKIHEVMRRCDGVIIVAYERKHVARGAEKRGSDAEVKFADRTYTTPWNHIESAIAFSLSLPIHILCQEGLAEEGLIETKVDWYVQRIHIGPGAFAKPQTATAIRTWVDERVAPHARRPSFLRAFTGTSRLSEMTPLEIVTTLGVLGATFALGAAVAVLFPNLFP